MSLISETGIPTVKALTGWSPSAVGIWSIVLILLFHTTRTAIIKGPEWIKVLGDRRRQDRDDEREATLGDRAEIAALSEKMSKMRDAFGFLANAVTTAINGLSIEDQGRRSGEAGRARELVAMAVSALGNEDPYALPLNRIASIPPVDKSPGT